MLPLCSAALRALVHAVVIGVAVLALLAHTVADGDVCFPNSTQRAYYGDGEDALSMQANLKHVEKACSC